MSKKEGNTTGKKREIIRSLQYLDSDSRKILGYYYFIEKHLKARNRLPLRVFEKFMSFFNVVESAETARKNALAESSIANVLATLPADYNFDYKTRPARRPVDPDGDVPAPPSHHYYLADMVSDAVYYAIGARTKEESIQLSYIAIMGYRSRLGRKTIKIITPYRAAVISGRIAIAFGFALTGKKNPNNEVVYQATRNSISKLEIK